MMSLLVLRVTVVTPFCHCRLIAGSTTMGADRWSLQKFAVAKVPALMGGFAKGLRAFKPGMKDYDAANVPVPRQITPP